MRRCGDIRCPGRQSERRSCVHGLCEIAISVMVGVVDVVVVGVGVGAAVGVGVAVVVMVGVAVVVVVGVAVVVGIVVRGSKET